MRSFFHIGFQNLKEIPKVYFCTKKNIFFLVSMLPYANNLNMHDLVHFWYHQVLWLNMLNVKRYQCIFISALSTS